MARTRPGRRPHPGRESVVPVRRATLAVRAIAAGLAATACGASPQAGPAPWAAAHPDPTGVHFTDAQGLCSITVRYPNDAPGEIDYQGRQFIQRERSTAPPAATGQAVGRSGDWTLQLQPDGSLLLLTPGAVYTYRASSTCGNNSAPPS
jgi:hypothetical protein